MTPLIPYKDLCSKYTPEQYKQSSRLLGIINAILKQCDDLEIAFFEILQALSLADAMGPALDYLGAIVGISRNVGEDDESYRVRIEIGRSLVGLPTPEALRRVLQFITGQLEIGIYPCYPAGLYFVLYEHSLQELPTNLNDYMTSGADLGQGTFLCCEEGEPWGLIVLEDNKQPIVIDQRWQDTEYAMVDDEGYLIVDDADNIVVGIDYWTTNESFETN